MDDADRTVPTNPTNQPQLLEAWKAAAAHPSLPGGGAELARYLIYSGLTFFLYNEVRASFGLVKAGRWLVTEWSI